MSIVGFNTISKRLAIAELEKKTNSVIEEEEMISVSIVQANTYERLNAIGDAIMSPQFALLPMEQKQAMLIDFAYFKSVADNL